MHAWLANMTPYIYACMAGESPGCARTAFFQEIEPRDNINNKISHKLSHETVSTSIFYTSLSRGIFRRARADSQVMALEGEVQDKADVVDHFAPDDFHTGPVDAIQSRSLENPQPVLVCKD